MSSTTNIKHVSLPTNLVDESDLQSFFGEHEALREKDLLGLAGVEVQVPRERGVLDWMRAQPRMDVHDEERRIKSR